MFSIKFLLLAIYIVAIIYTQFRGKVRLNFSKQVFNHGTLLAPINALMYLFSAVPNQPFFELKNFSALTKLQDNWQIIREEAQALVAQGYIKISTDNDDAGFNSFFKKGWKRFYLKWYSDFLPSAQTLCPKTIEFLKTIPEIKSAMFTLLPAGGRLNPHRDPYAGSLRYHLGLITPNSEKCRIYVDGVPYAWKDGEAVLFDETYIHAAKNETDTDRIILFCDVERPLNNKVIIAINRWVSKYLVAAAATQNLPTDPIGMINKLFKYYHAMAAQGDRLKKFNKPLYHFVKYGAILLIMYSIFFS